MFLSSWNSVFSLVTLYFMPKRDVLKWGFRKAYFLPRVVILRSQEYQSQLLWLLEHQNGKKNYMQYCNQILWWNSTIELRKIRIPWNALKFIDVAMKLAKCYESPEKLIKFLCNFSSPHIYKSLSIWWSLTFGNESSLFKLIKMGGLRQGFFQYPLRVLDTFYPCTCLFSNWIKSNPCHFSSIRYYTVLSIVLHSKVPHFISFKLKNLVHSDWKLSAHLLILAINLWFSTALKCG